MHVIHLQELINGVTDQSFKGSGDIHHQEVASLHRKDEEWMRPSSL